MSFSKPIKMANGLISTVGIDQKRNMELKSIALKIYEDLKGNKVTFNELKIIFQFIKNESENRVL